MKESFTVRFDIFDKKLFEPERRKFCKALASENIVPGARVTAVSSEDPFALDDYVEYLWFCLDHGTIEIEDILDRDEWEANGSPKKHDLKKQYKYNNEEV